MPNVIFLLSIPLRVTEIDAEFNALKVMVENTVAFFYLGDSSTVDWAPQVLDSLPTHSWEVILTNMKQSTSLTLGNLKSLYA
jgi:hypothetical protein